VTLFLFPLAPPTSSRESKWSQSRSSFFNDRYAAANPMTAPFFFESETTGLMFVRHRSPQSWYAFFRFPREDAAADYPCGHGGKKHPKLCLLHRGVLGRPTPSSAIIPRMAHQVLRCTSSGNSRYSPQICRAACTPHGRMITPFGR